MRLTRGRLHHTVVVVVAFAILGLVPTAARAAVVLPPGQLVPPTSGSFLYLNSEPGDFVGRGLEQLYVGSEYTEVDLTSWGPDSATVRVMSPGHDWSARFVVASGQLLAVGSYTGAIRATGPAEPTPSLSVSGDTRGCNTLTGSFDINDLRYSSYGELLVVDVTFEQHCEGAVPALFGRVRFESEEPRPGVTLVPEAIQPPSGGSFLYFNSDYWDYIGNGAEQLFTAPPLKVSASLVPGGDFFRGSMRELPFGHSWTIDVAAPAGQALQVGSYIRAERASFRSAGMPGLDVGGDGRGCNDLTGKFDIDELSFSSSGRLLVFQVTFEQHCSGRVAALHGRFRYEYVPTPPGVTLPQGAMTVPTSGSFLYLNGEPGSYVGGGVEQLYTSADSVVSGAMLTPENDYFRGNIAQGANVHYFYVDVAAPAGQALAIGSYVDAARASFRPAGSPGIDLWGDGRGMNDLVGKFDVNELSYWSNGDIKVFQVTFQIGEVSPFIFGRFRYEGPAPLQLTVALNPDATVIGKTNGLRVSGTVACSRNAFVEVTGSVSQNQGKGVVVTGAFQVSVQCVAPQTAWTAVAAADIGGFKPGAANGMVTASSCDTHCYQATSSRALKVSPGKS